MYIEKRGQGKALILLHGWGMNSLVWQPLLTQLETQYSLYLVDLPGYGHSPLPQGDSLNKFCDWAAEHLPEQAHWLGWSMGGLYMLAFAQRYPNHPASLCLLASNPKFVQATDWAGVEIALFEQFAQMLSRNIDATIERFLAIQAMGAPQAKAQIKHLRQLLRAAPQAEPAALQHGLQLLEACDFRSLLVDLTLPLSVVLGERDKLVPVTVAEQLLVLRPDAEYLLVPSAGHAPFITHPQQVAKFLTGWWENQP